MTLHRWTDREGQAWACAASDHGPFCRLCQPVDPDDAVTERLFGLVDLGLVDVRAAPNGELTFNLTEAGRGVAHALLEEDSEMFAFWLRAQGLSDAGEP